MKQNVLKSKCLLLIFMPFIVQAQTNSFKQDSATLVESAYKTLKAEMGKNDFEKLNWQNVMVDTLSADFFSAFKLKPNAVKSLLKISSKNDTSKFILYTEHKGQKYFNWVFLNAGNDSTTYTDSIETFTVRNQLINSWQIKKNRVVKGNDISYKNANTDSIPLILITGTISTDSSKFVAFGLNYLLFSGKIKKDDFLSNLLFCLKYNILIFDPFYNGYESVSSGPLPLKITQENN